MERPGRGPRGNGKDQQEKQRESPSVLLEQAVVGLRHRCHSAAKSHVPPHVPIHRHVTDNSAPADRTVEIGSGVLPCAKH